MMMFSQLSVNSEDVPLYQPAKALPIELQEQCAIYLEEGLHSESLTLLSSLLISGTCSSAKHLIPAFVPPPSFLSFLATLIVHPSTTTRAKSDDGQAVANQALQYLQSLHQIVGPINARLATAFSFRSNSNFRGRTTPGKRRRDDDASGDDEKDGQLLNTKLAQAQSLWTCAESFWHVVGWAFNCATTSKRRWQRWKLWLEFMLDVLEADLAEQSKKATAMESAEDRDALFMKSFAAQCTAGLGSSNSQTERRRAMRAIFAHGTPRDMAEFKEIWKDETKEREVKDMKPPLKTGEHRPGLTSLESEDEDNVDGLDIDMVEVKVEGQGSARTTRRTTRSIKPAVEDSDDVEGSSEESTVDAVDAYGGLDAIYLRRRLLHLLCRLSSVSTVFATTDVLLDLFSEFCRPLPLPLFSVILMPTGAFSLPGPFNGSLCKELFRPLLSGTAPRFDTNYASQEDMESRYLASTASSSTVWDNAKVSLLMEALLWLLRDNNSLKYNVRLNSAVTKGIQARQDKVKQSKGGKGGKKHLDAEAEQGLASLNASSKRLEMLMILLRG